MKTITIEHWGSVTMLEEVPYTPKIESIMRRFNNNPLTASTYHGVNRAFRQNREVVDELRDMGVTEFQKHNKIVIIKQNNYYEQITS